MVIWQNAFGNSITSLLISDLEPITSLPLYLPAIFLPVIYSDKVGEKYLYEICAA